jgi:hypothetical protein
MRGSQDGEDVDAGLLGSNVTPCGLVDRYQCSGGTYCLHLQHFGTEDGDYYQDQH